MSDKSNSESDSQPSEDNLDPDYMLKLIPKKLRKNKYIGGIENNIKKNDLENKNKSKIELMPCLQNKMKEINKNKETADILQKK